MSAFSPTYLFEGTMWTEGFVNLSALSLWMWFFLFIFMLSFNIEWKTKLVLLIGRNLISTNLLIRVSIVALQLTNN